MSLNISNQSDSFSTCPQIAVADIAEIAALGFKSIINNRPDGEGGVEQPTSAQIKTAAENAGLSYAFIPVIPGNITDDNVSQCAAFMANAPAPVLAFCRTGARAGNLHLAVQALLAK
jgi:uncharacterized protein (TIGR01244 family)